jgi:predicted PurR-regulated permease PerM
MQKWTSLLTVVSTVLVSLLLIAAIIHLTSYLSHTILLFALGALFAYALDPVVDLVCKVRIGKSGGQLSRELSVSAVFVGLFLLLAFAGWSLGGHLRHQVADLKKKAPDYRARALVLATGLDTRLAEDGLHYHLSDMLTNPPPEVGTVTTDIEKTALPIVGHVLTGVGESLVVLLISAYFLLSGSEMKDGLNNMLPAELRRRAILWETDVNRILGGFVRGQITIALIIGLGAAVGCLLMGIHLWLLIGLFAVVAALIPVFGPYIGAVPAIIAALIGPTYIGNPVASAIVIGIYFTIINEIGSKILYPKLVGKALGLHAVLVLFVLFAGLEIGGVEGVLFAAPMTAVVIVTTVHLYRLWQDLPDDLLSKDLSEETVIVKTEPT